MDEQFADIKMNQNEELHDIRIQLKDKSQEVSDLRKILDISKIKEATFNNQMQHVQDRLQKTTTELEDTKMRETSKAKDKEFDTLLQKYKEQVNTTAKELKDTQSRLNEVNQMAQMKEKSLKREISELRKNINELTLKNETLNGDLQQTRENLRKTTFEFEEERKRQKEAIDRIRIKLHDKSKDVSNLRTMVDISKAKEATFNHQMQHVQDELQKTTTELEDTKTRLSKFMGQQLTDNNSNITDLSDKNRPTKLSERFSELYDNEWTDAFEVLGSIYKDERKTVITLITILKDADKYCREEAEKQMERLRKALTLNMETDGSDIPILINKQMKDCRKALATAAGQHLFEVYTKELSQKSPTRDSAKSALCVPAFLREAFMLCWLMTIQDPPVVFDRLLQHGAKFNTELYRSYTKSGPLVDFPVWPTMFLHEGGPVLCKGVAQGCHK
ncbi:hypothetical protein DPMN_163960 [Dreissena polymorpha]|uniref:Mitochondria-eating protein n=1 Tax=Dreissena polymorpha TaxID=45954 RepID=A0A9D4EXM5_DREPO|nr:hypothetical protein DPMN_163960 [Dreissena polymorpha]